jgi:DNA polymerase-3 subunit alpha
VIIGGMLTQVRYMNTKKARNGNSRYCRCKLEDFTGSAECVMWPDDFVRYKDYLVEGQICFVVASVERTREQPGLVINRILTIDQAQRERTTGLVVDLSLETDADLIQDVARVLSHYQGQCPVFVFVRDAAGKLLKLKASEEFRINPGSPVKGELEMILGTGRVHFSRQGNGYTRNGR